MADGIVTSADDVAKMTPTEKMSLLSVLKARSGKGELSDKDKALAAALGVDFPNDPDEWTAAKSDLQKEAEGGSSDSGDDDDKDPEVVDPEEPDDPSSGDDNPGGDDDDPGDDDDDEDDEEDPFEEDEPDDPEDIDEDDPDDPDDEEDNDADADEPAKAAEPTTYNPTKTDAKKSQPGDKLVTRFENVGIVQGRNLATGGTSWIKTPPKSTGSSSSFKAETLADSLNYAAMKLVSLPISQNGRSMLEQGFTARSIPDYSEKTFLDQVVEMAYESSGAGSSETQIAQVFSRLDRFSRSMAPRNAVFSGYTFFTRPRLCLRDWNIVSDRKLAALKTTDVLSMPFAIRCYLDTQFASDSDKAGQCPLFDKYNPFLVPLCNAVKSISGFNDPMLVTETTDGGFFSEDQTYVIGGDRMARTYDINCQFRDYPGSPILALVDYWCQYMANLTDGSMQQYADAIDANRIDYTISIYRFLMDRTNRNIVRWCKCTGCYPVSPPSGVSFNMNEGEFMVNAAAELNVPFKANRIEYDDPVILKEFNVLVRRYGKEMIFGSGKIAAFDQIAQNNFSGVPYIRPGSNGYELVWLRRNGLAGEYTIADADNDVSDIKKSTGANGTITTEDTKGESGKAVL